MPPTTCTFFRLLHHDDKAAALRQAVDALRDQHGNADTHVVDPASFEQVPGSPLAYWVSEAVRSLFATLPSFENERRRACITNPAGDDQRYFRCFWEVPSNQIGRNTQWSPITRGGKYNPYYIDVQQLVAWDEQEQTYRGFLGTPHRPLKKPASLQYFFRPGITWPLRGIHFSAQALPQGCIFSVAGKFATSDDSSELPILLGLMNSQQFDFLIGLFAGKVGGVQYEVGLINKIPIPSIKNSSGERIGQLALECVKLKQSLDTANELSHLFFLPALLQVQDSTLAARVAVWQAHVAQTDHQLAAHQREIDDIAFRLYGIDGEDRRTIERSLQHGGADAQNEEVADDEGDNDAAPTLDGRALVADLVSYLIGCALGRWDVRCATGERTAPPVPDPFAPLPVYAPGVLQPNADQSNGTNPQPNILVDDPGHPDDLVARLRAVLAHIWGDAADDIYAEAVATLVGSGLDLRPWLRSAFFEQHIKRYSKSRRKAPIYWCLSTPSRSYAVWLYYHALTDDTLYQVLNDYVLPKIQHEERRLVTLQTEGGANPTASQRKAVETQEAFLDELRTFRDEIAQVAPLWRPNRNDGVIINFAPLWRLSPWPRSWQKECRQTWDALGRGDYDWSHLALHLWPQRVVPKCAADRSLAIAHDLDAVFWQEDNGKAQPRAVSDEEIDLIVRQRSSPAVNAALHALHDAPVDVPAPKKRSSTPKAAAGKRGRKAAPAVQSGFALEDDDAPTA